MRKIIAALQISLDGFIEGPAGEIDWIRSWKPFDSCRRSTPAFLVAGCIRATTILGRHHGRRRRRIPFTGAIATQGEADYARFARDAPHVVLSTTLERAIWPNTRIIRDA